MCCQHTVHRVPVDAAPVVCHLFPSPEQQGPCKHNADVVWYTAHVAQLEMHLLSMHHSARADTSAAAHTLPADLAAPQAGLQEHARLRTLREA